MKLLIAYDGSRCSEAALDDLARAGLPDEGEALIFSVAETWLTPPENGENVTEHAHKLATDPQYLKNHGNGGKAVLEVETLANHARKRLQRFFPRWKIEAETAYGTSPASEILQRAETFEPDLIVAGSHGRTAIGRFLLGSISQKVLTEANCSVRIARGKVEVDPTPVRIIIGFDGSPGAEAAVEEVVSRKWREHSQVHLVTATAPIAPSTIGRFVPPIVHWVEEVNQSEREWIEKLAEKSLIMLGEAGLEAKLYIPSGNPKQVLVEEADRWSADCIFVGANAFGSRLERVFLGSVSEAVAKRASCSVEVIRKKTKE
ncbi:MAG TPA: universal stress protein [Pyrinomonadaceae bacterium]|nr:universal stress protein [Pyrinomonadaceae bacterium]